MSMMIKDEGVCMMIKDIDMAVVEQKLLAMIADALRREDYATVKALLDCPPLRGKGLDPQIEMLNLLEDLKQRHVARDTELVRLKRIQVGEKLLSQEQWGRVSFLIAMAVAGIVVVAIMITQ